MALLTFTAERKGEETQEFSNPYDAMGALLGTTGEADVAVITDAGRTVLMHRDADDVWSEVK
jgi:hypothetical protein